MTLTHGQDHAVSSIFGVIVAIFQKSLSSICHDRLSISCLLGRIESCESKCQGQRSRSNNPNAIWKIYRELVGVESWFFHQKVVYTESFCKQATEMTSDQRSRPQGQRLKKKMSKICNFHAQKLIFQWILALELWNLAYRKNVICSF